MPDNIPLILGSASPRRRQLLRDCGYRFDVIVSSEEEIPAEGLPAVAVPEDLARQKALHLAARLQMDDYVLLTADTVVILEGAIIGKPVDHNDAFHILERLSGKRHEVVSGVCLAGPDHQESFSDTTTVTFRHLSGPEIDAYLRHFEVLDKAGAYAIQEWIGLIGITSIEGSFYNVMGLPVHRVYEHLLSRGIVPAF